jgi:general secretion pathway protein M
MKHMKHMKHSLPTGRTGQLLALGLTSLALATLWLGVVMPLIEWHADRAAELGHQEMLTQRMEILAAALPTLKEQAKAVAAGGAGEAALLEGDNDSMASASLQERLQAMFMQTGVQLNSVETLPGDDAGAYRRIGLRISFNASWPILMTLLKEMHVATPALLVDELQLTPALHRISSAPGTFDVACAIFAFRAASPAKVAVR